MNKLIKCAATGLLLSTMAGSAASAASVTSLFGDKDSFGTGKAQDATISINEVRASTASAADGDTDAFRKGVFSWMHEFDLGGADILSATLTISTFHLEDYFGSADPTGPYDTLLFIDDVEYAGAFDDVGTFPPGTVDTQNRRNVTTFNLDSAFLAALADGKLKVAMNSAGTDRPDYFAIDYAELNIVTADDVATVPLPAALAFLLSGIASIGLIARRKSAA